MVKLEDDEDLLDDFDDDFKEDKPIPQYSYDYKSRRILVWVEEEENRQIVEETLAFLLPLATIRMVNNEEKAFETSEKEEWDTFVVDLTEENVSTSEFVKVANNNQEIAIIALDYSHLGKSSENSEIYYDSIRKLFDLKAPGNNSENQE
jgi:DNA-binding NtrC family response regulator